MPIDTSLDNLTPDTRAAVTQLLVELEAQDLHPKLGETYRTQKRQNELVKLSKKRKHPLTKTSNSWHTVGRAVDLDISPVNENTVSVFFAIASNLGFRTMDRNQKEQARIAKGGKLVDTWDLHHLEYRGGRDYATAYKEYTGKQLNTAGPSIMPLIYLGLLLSYPKWTT